MNKANDQLKKKSEESLVLYIIAEVYIKGLES